MSKEIKVTFEPSGRTVYVLPGTILLEAAARAGFIIEQPCGGMGTCGKCLVRVTAGQCSACSDGEKRLSPARLADGYRLACQCRIQSAMTVEIPETSLFQAGHQILASDAGGQTELKPSVTKRVARISLADRGDERSDAERLLSAMDGAEPSLGALRQLPYAMREADGTFTATLSRGRIVRLDAGDTSSRLYGMAFDIGTTTLVGTLMDLTTGREMALASAMNPQTSFGDDVVSRIKVCREDPEGLGRLHKAIVAAVNKLTTEACRQAGVTPTDVAMAVFAGNTTMQQILAGINPMALGEIPFAPAFRDLLRLTATDLGLNTSPTAEVVIFPQIGGFVGGDTVAGIVATRLDESAAPTLLVDVGTNGEIVLAYGDELIATSVAAGPAFEGARIHTGMRATRGAIEKVVFDDDVRLNVIGDAKPAGICGTGLIDAAAALLQSGVLDPTGRILGPDELPASLGETIRRRVVPNDSQFDFLLVDAARTASGQPLLLYQRDIRELQLANAAIRAGIAILLRTAGLQPGDLGEVLLAGAFGNFIRRSNALRIGMLPALPHDRIRFVGNAASFGAKRVLLSGEQASYATRVARRVRHVDLSLSPDFQMEFADAMMFP